MSEEKSIIDEELAKAFLEDPDSMERKIQSFGTEITDEAAELLSKYEGDELRLDSLVWAEHGLSDAAAESLSKYEGWLNLDGLEELSDAAAQALSKHKGGLSLDGLRELSDAAAESFSKHEDYLSLNYESCEDSGIIGPELSDAAVKSLSKHNGKINGEDPKDWNWLCDQYGNSRPKRIFGYWK